MPTGKIIKKIYCRRCKRLTNHELLNKTSSDESDDESEIWVTYTYETLRCQGCEAVSLLEEYLCSEDIDPNTGQPDPRTTIYPSVSYSNHEELDEWYRLPNKISKIYRETISAYNSNLPILTGIGLRTIVEAICQDQGITAGVLKVKIDKLAEIGLMTKKESELLHLNRYIGNAATHEIINPPKEDLKTGIDIIEAAFLNAYILPEKAKTLKGRA